MIAVFLSYMLISMNNGKKNSNFCHMQLVHYSNGEHHQKHIYTETDTYFHMRVTEKLKKSSSVSIVAGRVPLKVWADVIAWQHHMKGKVLTSISLPRCCVIVCGISGSATMWMQNGHVYFKIFYLWQNMKNYQAKQKQLFNPLHDTHTDTSQTRNHVQWMLYSVTTLEEQCPRMIEPVRWWMFACVGRAILKKNK